jgi:hypothetical protein
MISSTPFIGHGTGNGNGSGNKNRATVSFLNWKPEHYEIRPQESSKGGLALAIGGGLAVGAIALWASTKGSGGSQQSNVGQETSKEEEAILSMEMKLEAIRRRQQKRADVVQSESQA